jgi:prepilin-type N-terminal cleavage/methylation domain-containing protein
MQRSEYVICARGRVMAPRLHQAAMLPCPHETSATHGRSLIEVITAIAISSILLMIAVPRFTALSAPYVLRQTTAQIADALTAARMRAITRNARIRFSYNATNKTYTLDREVASGTWTAEYANQMPAGASLTAPATAPIFDSRGMLNQATTIPVSVQGYTTTRTVTINVLGNVKIS